MVFVSALKVYTTFSCRRFMSDMRMALEIGYLAKSCAFSSISNYMMNPELTPIQQHLVYPCCAVFASHEVSELCLYHEIGCFNVRPKRL